MNSPDTNATQVSADQLAVAAWQKILAGVKDLEAAYDAHPELNDTQPANAELCIPMSLDEWKVEIMELIEELQDRK